MEEEGEIWIKRGKKREEYRSKKFDENSNKNKLE